MPYTIAFAKQVINPLQKETTLHTMLAQYTERVNPKREFFRVPKEEVKTMFDLSDGEWWGESTKGVGVVVNVDIDADVGVRLNIPPMLLRLIILVDIAYESAR